MHYIVYKITNLLNDKIYIGVHKTMNIDDNYMGSGIAIKSAINKYGIANFRKEIISETNSAEAMYIKESEIVNEDFVNRRDTYNMKLGGRGGFESYNSSEKHKNSSIKGGQTTKNLYLDEDFAEIIKTKKEKNFNDKLIINKNHKSEILENRLVGIRSYYSNGGTNGFLDKAQTQEVKDKISQANKNKVSCRDLRDGSTYRVTKEEFYSKDYLVGN